MRSIKTKGVRKMRLKTMALALALVLPFGTGAVNASMEEITIVGTGDGMSLLASVGTAFSKANANVKILIIDGTSAADPGYPSIGIMALIFKEESNKGDISNFLAFVTSSAARGAIRSANAIPY